MTNSEKKTTDSEINRLQSFSRKMVELTLIDISFQYIFIDSARINQISSPIDGHIHIFVPTCEQASHYPYTINRTNFILQIGEHAIHPIRIGEALRWTISGKNTKVLVLFITTETTNNLTIPFLEQQYLFDKSKTYQIDSLTDHILHRVHQLHKDEKHLNKLRIPSLLIEMLTYQFESILLKQSKTENNITRNIFDKINLAQQLLEQDLSKNYTISELSKLVGTNEQYLKKYFKQYFGKTIMSYITDLKLQHAKALIINSDYRIADIARLLGYKHSTHFSTAFKRHFGIVPNSLRTNNRA